MKILIIGGNGFIGSHLVDELIANDHQVRVFDMAYERYRAPLKGVDYRIGSLEDMHLLYEALLGMDMVFHLASASVPSTSNIDAVSDVNRNLIATLNVLNAVVKMEIKRFVYFSSGGSVYGTSDAASIGEDHPLRPISSYGIIKATVEHYLGLYKKLHGLNSLIIRPSNPYGPRQGHFIAQGVISTFLKKVKMGEPISIFGNGLTSKDYIYIKDLVNICHRLSVKCEEGVFNVGSGTATSLVSIVDHIKTITGKSPQVTYSEFKNYDVPDFVLDINRARHELGELPMTSLTEGISKTWQWICENDQNPAEKK